ncbi:sigma-70 family RNA polymerase sigma factor [Mumia quercus]|uniref:sigma-70 family RNA polymerase sigma factor n=1 Tax=Mumia quercus TaxID=2976125 RepID=UPI0021D1B8E3|nr:sigma-70 family RNA polymerase sigma factor [Mumia quercus]
MSTATVAHEMERYRGELKGYCARRLGSESEADDAVQETLIRAWRSGDTFEGRASVRSWLYRIATNVCHDASGSRRRRPEPRDPHAAEHAAHPTVALVAPDPAEVSEQREAVRDAFATAVRVLPPRQRAVLVLRDVLRWRAAEVAALLGTSTVSVNSALQRARATLREAETGAKVALAAAPQVERYVAAFVAYDVDALVALLRTDALSAVRR